MTDPKTWRIAAVGGDGIGPEVMSVALDTLDALTARRPLAVEVERLSWPSTAWHHKHGSMMPADGLDRLRDYDAILLGALGDPGPGDDPDRYVIADSTALAPLLEMRRGFDLWACERPARLWNGAHQYLCDPRAKEVDMLVIRENSEGEYVAHGGRLHRGSAEEVATETGVFSRRATERVIRHAFRRAGQRMKARADGGGQRQFPGRHDAAAGAQVCLITKRNALPHSGELYCEVMSEVADEFPDIGVHHELVDAACMKFVTAPWQFDVVVASNLHGDILTDLAAVLCGGMALAPSANINPDRRDVPPVFEPTHGSAPDIAGRGIADPRAMLMTMAWMLEWMGELDGEAAHAAAALNAAIRADLAEHAGRASRSTEQTVRDIIEQLDN